jgi:hypothetical protein
LGIFAVIKLIKMENTLTRMGKMGSNTKARSGGGRG